MPISPAAMATRSRHTEEELRLKSEIYNLERTISKSKPRKNTRMMEVLVTVWEYFDASDKPRLPALELEQLKQVFHPPTYNRAKKLLGIRSVRRDGKWYWTRPQRTPTQAIEIDFQHKQALLNDAQLQLEQLDTQVCRELRDIITASHLHVTNVEAFKEMLNRGFGRSSVLQAKAKLRIASKKIDGEWIWIWQTEEVQQWLLEFLGDKRIPATDIFAAAFEQHHWHYETVKMAKEAIGSIMWGHDKELQRVVWYNNSQVSTSSPKPVTTRIVSVDFTEESTILDREVKVGSVKIGVLG